MAQPVTKKKSSNTKVILILGAVIVAIAGLAFAALAGLAALDDTPELASGDLKWASYRQPDGHFQLQLPGEAEVSTIEVPSGFGNTTDLEVVGVNGIDFVASVWTYPEAVQSGMTFADIPFSEDGAVEGAAANGFKNGKVVSHKTLEATGSTQMDLEMQGTVDKDDAIMLSRLIIVGTNMFEVTLSGPTEHRDALLDAHAKMTESFKSPA